MWPKMFSSRDAQAFGRELAAFILDELGQALAKSDPKFKVKAEKALTRAARRIDQFKTTNKLNWFQRSRAANAFLWALKDRQCPPAYADELTEWFVARL